MANPSRKRPFGKVTFTFTSVIIVLLISTITSFVLFSNQTNSLESQTNSLQYSLDQLQANYDNLQTQFNQLSSQYQQLKSSSSSTQAIDDLQNQIDSLELQLANARDLIAQLQGPSGILPTYMSLKYEGPVSSGGSYYLQLSLKNTGNVSINQIFVALKSEQITMSFTYLDKTVSVNDPLPAYQTASGRQDVTPPVNNAGTYPLVIQAIASNGAIYTYETTITNQ